MFVLFILFAAAAFVNSDSDREYNNLSDLLKIEYFLKTTTTTTTTIVTVITTTTTTTINKIDQIKKIANNINVTNEAVKILLPSICVFILTIFSIICHFARKCYLNDGDCKQAWFYLKTPAEYRRRREIARNKKVVLDQIIVQSSSSIYAIA
ncbi:unnamed protein product [Rotaria socialis]|uniref:Uncharacterized protein n=1 Tax=Rotaria socialis TaxID=392032 RepID=A0A817PDY5_9BILA|nr:unnamed protein product [Rotaria socialis]CAF3291067.1 unnamed protein product [Rotaria socialis]CAF3376945.1 unnamed protein product [Rotaria socialis]CAF4499339.1 unnamed protein product [Rotaria socialis]CAF4556655.1 unnamed protein product [Rotaria socialis]